MQLLLLLLVLLLLLLQMFLASVATMAGQLQPRLLEPREVSRDEVKAATTGKENKERASISICKLKTHLCQGNLGLPTPCCGPLR